MSEINLDKIIFLYKEIEILEPEIKQNLEILKEIYKTIGKNLEEINTEKTNIHKFFIEKITEITKEILNNEEEKRVNESYKKINNAPLYINTVAGITINEFKEKCRKFKLEKDIQLIVINTATINDTKVNILKTINELAKELEVTIIVTAPTIENNNIPLKQELKELVEIMNIADITIYLKLGNDEEKGIAHCLLDTKEMKNVIDLIYLTEYNKFNDLIVRY